jgi:hypothetical protein
VSFNPILGSSGLNSFGAGRFLGTGIPEFRDIQLDIMYGVKAIYPDDAVALLQREGSLRPENVGRGRSDGWEG